MESILTKKLVWWRDVPVDVEIGLLKYLCKVWQNKIYVICANEYDVSRRICSWDNISADKLTLIIGKDEIARHQTLIDSLITSDCIHISSGVKGGHRKFLDSLNSCKSANNHCILISESPSLYGNCIIKLIKSILYPIIYKYNRKKYSQLFNSLFAIGQEAYSQYLSYGWQANTVHRFMYLPDYETADLQKQNTQRTVRLMYIGRFNYATKGVNCLMKAIEQLSATNRWQLDLIGGYGEQAEEIIDWCNNTPNVNFLGTWNNNEIVNKMGEYDICIVPSAYDGWNMAPFQCLKAGIACIVSDNAGSQELIEKSNAGAIFHTGNHHELKTILEEAINDTTIIERWHNNAVTYKDKISVEIVGKYFVDALQYSFNESQQKPICPWLGE